MESHYRKISHLKVKESKEGKDNCRWFCSEDGSVWRKTITPGKIWENGSKADVSIGLGAVNKKLVCSHHAGRHGIKTWTLLYVPAGLI